MSLIYCRECGAQISKRAASCPQCGARDTSSSIASEKSYIFLAIGIALFFFVFIPFLKVIGILFFLAKIFS